MKKRISNIYKKAMEVRLYRDPMALNFIIAVLIFVIGIIIGANFFGKGNGGSQIDIALTDSSVSKQIDQPQDLSNQEQHEVVSKEGASLQQTADYKNTTDAMPQSAAKFSNSTKSVTITVKKNDNLTKIFKRNGIDVKDVKAILALKQAKSLRDLRSGKKISLNIEKNKTGSKLKQLIYIIDDLNTLNVVYSNGWSAKIKHIEPTVKLSYAATAINGSDYNSVSKKGISHKVMAQLANIFSKKVDIRKMHKGDRLAVLYKEYAVNGKKIKEGEIVAAEIVHKGQIHRMIGFADQKGNTDYYTPEGFNNNPPFIRTPLTNYTRIGSRFSSNRRHPILGYSRPHNGVDFSASYGTPIKATSNGTVDFAGNHGEHGRTVMIKRGIYKTLYAHLSKFANGIRSGSSVSKGQIIGYVGKSGLATGPHLHYELHVGGVPHDPLKVKLPDGEMIAPEHRKNFFALARRVLAQLEMHRKSYIRTLAMNEFVKEDIV